MCILGCDACFLVLFFFFLGKQYRFLDRHMDPARWDALAGTYNLGSLSRVRAALGTCRELFSESSRRVAAALGCPYPDYEEKVSRYLDYYLKG